VFDYLIISPCSTFTLKEMDMICCNCDFIYGPVITVTTKNQIQQNPDLAGF